MGNTITCGESEAAGGVLDPMIHSGIPDCGANATALPQAGFFVNGTGFPCNNTSLLVREDEGHGRNTDWDWLIGISLSMGSSVLSCLGLILQKVAHNQNQVATAEKKYKVVAGIICSPCWWMAFVVMGLFPFPLDFFAFQFAAQSLVAVFAGFTLICNQIMAPCILKERLSKIDVVASAIVVGGTTVATIFGSHELEHLLTPRGDSSVYFITLTGKRRSRRETEFNLCELLDMSIEPTFLVAESCLITTMIVLGLLIRQTSPDRMAARFPGYVSIHSKPAEPEPEGESSGDDSSPKKPADGAGGAAPDTDAADVHLDMDDGGAEVAQFAADTSLEKQGVLTEGGELNAHVPKLWRGLAMARPVFFGFIAGGFGAQQNIVFKSAGELVKLSIFNGGHDYWASHPHPWIFCIICFTLAAGQITTLNTSLAQYDAVLSLPLYNACYILLACSFGGMYYDEFAHMGTGATLAFAAGITVTASGVLLLSYNYRPQGQERKAALEPSSSSLQANESA